MSMLSLILIIVFIVISVLLILIVSIQDEKQSGLAGVFGGSGGSAFGAQTASVVVKATTVLSVLFFVLALALALINKGGPAKDDVLIENERNQAIEASASPTESEVKVGSDDAVSVPADESQSGDADSPSTPAI